MTIPPLLGRMDGKRTRLRREHVHEPSELSIHIGTVNLLRRFGHPAWPWFHPANGEVRDKRAASKLRAMAVTGGVPDLILFNPAGRSFFIDFKSSPRGLTDQQSRWMAWAEAAGLSFVIVRSLGEAIHHLSAWGALRVRISGHDEAEPNGRFSDLPLHDSPAITGSTT